MATRTRHRFEVTPTTALERHVTRWVRERMRDYPDDGPEGLLKDLAYGGCASGMVGHLVYTRDCVRFYARHRKEIAGLLKESMSDMGADGPAGLFGDKWDAEDPLASDDANQTLLAHFAFEETARKLAAEAGIEV